MDYSDVTNYDQVVLDPEDLVRGSCFVCTRLVLTNAICNIRYFICSEIIADSKLKFIKESVKLNKEPKLTFIIKDPNR